MQTIAAFVHIPKNAGSYVTWLLRSYFGIRHCRVVASDKVAYAERDLLLDRRLYPGLRCISGHNLRPYVDFGQLEPSLTWATVLRDPWERFPSHYRWWCKKSGTEMSFPEWCELKGEKFSNYQCRWIAGVPDADRALRVIRERNMLVGDQHDLGAFLRAWVAREAWPAFPLVHEVVNATRPRRSSGLELVEKYNHADIELFRRCRDEGVFASEADAVPTSTPRSPSRSAYYLNLCKHVVLYKPYRRICDLGIREAEHGSPMGAP